MTWAGIVLALAATASSCGIWLLLKEIRRLSDALGSVHGLMTDIAVGLEDNGMVTPQVPLVQPASDPKTGTGRDNRID